jgi:hypothetical protein
VPKHSNLVQLRPAGDGRGNPCGVDSVRQEAVGIHEAVEEVAAVARRLIDSLVTAAEPRDREEWAARAKQRAAERFAR